MEDKYTARQFIDACRQFAESEFGTYYLDLLHQRHQYYLDQATQYGRGAEQKAMDIERAAALREAFGVIEEAIQMGESPEMLKRLEEEEKKQQGGE